MYEDDPPRADEKKTCAHNTSQLAAYYTLDK